MLTCKETFRFIQGKQTVLGFISTGLLVLVYTLMYGQMFNDGYSLPYVRWNMSQLWAVVLAPKPLQVLPKPFLVDPERTADVPANTPVIRQPQKILKLDATGWINQLDYFLPPPGHLCASSPDFILLVLSVPGHFSQRQIIRKTWGSVSNIYVASQKRTVSLKMGFLLGRRKNVTEQKIIADEFKKYGDIIQANYTDYYRNITYKSVLALKFAAEFCSTSSFLVKADDDIFMNPFNMANIAPYSKIRTIVGKEMRNTPVLRSGKWAVSVAERKSNVYPPYCSGPTFIVTMDAVLKLYDLAMKTKFFVIDDVFVTGLLRLRLKITLNDVPNMIGLMQYHLRPTCSVGKFVSYHQIIPGQQYKVWDFLLRLRQDNTTKCPFN